MNSGELAKPLDDLMTCVRELQGGTAAERQMELYQHFGVEKGKPTPTPNFSFPIQTRYIKHK